MSKLKRIYLNGFKSFRYVGRSLYDDAKQNQSGNAVEFGDITVLLGANGAGKSNIVSFFRMLNIMMTEALQEFVGKAGGASSLLHFGSKTTPTMHALVEFESDQRKSRYEMIFADAPPDNLIFTDERVFDHGVTDSEPIEIVLQVGQRESTLPQQAGEDATCSAIHNMLSGCRTYQFHDTSAAANVRKPSYIENARYLMSDAGNLAAYLYAMRESKPERRYYDRIVSTIQQVYPQFKDFDIEPSRLNSKNIVLNWRENGNTEYLFGPHQLSDGILRFMALATLFLQPPQRLPSVIVIDEPELGLHPHAITVLAGMIHGVSDKCQVVLSTQSTRLVDEFEVGQIVVVERDRNEHCSRCRRPDAKALEDWIRQYSTSELWEKNVLGGRP